jgi:diacylglycerol kinase family enzyme
MRTEIILNAQAGSLINADRRLVAERIRKLFEEAGHDVRVAVVNARDMADHIRKARDAGACEALVAAGGDGTISCAAAILAGSEIALGILPGGTMNLFARTLNLPLDLEDAAAALALGRPDRVDICEVNEQPFLHHLTLGLHPRILRLRESLEYGSRLGKMRAGFKAWMTALRTPPNLRVEAWVGGERITLNTPALAITNNAMQSGLGRLPYSDDPQGGRLALYACTSQKGRDLLQLSINVILGTWDDNPVVEKRQAGEIVVHPSRKKVMASLDGELVRLETPLRVRIRKQGLRVLLPLSVLDA